MLNHTADYALRAVLFIATMPDDRPVRVNQVSDALGIPRNYLSKVLAELVRKGILASLRGPRGGFRLAVDARILALETVIGPFDPLEDRCLLSHRECNGDEPCITHRRWLSVAERIRGFFRETTVGDLLESGGQPSVCTAAPGGAEPRRAPRAARLPAEALFLRPYSSCRDDESSPETQDHTEPRAEARD